MDIIVMPKSKVWLSGRLQPSVYPPLKTQNTALGLTLPVWWHWGGAWKDPTAPALAERGPSPNPKVAETDSIPTPDVPPTSKPEGAVCPEELALVPRRQPPFPLGLLFVTWMTLGCHLWRMCMGLWLCQWVPH